MLKNAEDRFNDEHSRDGSGTAAKRRYSVQPDTEVRISFTVAASCALVSL